jgi:hypothetical protein
MQKRAGSRLTPIDRSAGTQESWDAGRHVISRLKAFTLLAFLFSDLNTLKDNTKDFI